MMTRLITTIVFIICFLALTAQPIDKTFFVGNVISDTSTFKADSYCKAMTSILKSGNKIEIRFITSPSFELPNYTILAFNKKWSAKHLYNQPDIDSLVSKDINKKVNLDTLFARLVVNNIFSLPDQDKLITKKLTYDPEKNEFIGLEMAVNDGICYYIEFKIGGYYRRYGYCNPESYADFYPQVYELRNFANIVELFNECTE